MGRPSLVAVLATRLTSFLEMPTASVKMSAVSNPLREMCLSPVAVSMPTCWNALLMSQSFIVPFVSAFVATDVRRWPPCVRIVPATSSRRWLLLDFCDCHRPVFFGAEVRGVHERHGLEIVASADLWFGAVLQRNEQLRHRAGKGI